jgi:hypothetical protein
MKTLHAKVGNFVFFDLETRRLSVTRADKVSGRLRGLSFTSVRPSFGRRDW